MPKRRNYSPEFKHEAVKLTRMERITISQIARDLGITICWVVGVASCQQTQRRHSRDRASPGMRRLPGSDMS